jgi:hypothetical protein
LGYAPTPRLVKNVPLPYSESLPNQPPFTWASRRRPRGLSWRSFRGPALAEAAHHCPLGVHDRLALYGGGCQINANFTEVTAAEYRRPPGACGWGRSHQGWRRPVGEGGWGVLAVPECSLARRRQCGGDRASVAVDLRAAGDEEEAGKWGLRAGGTPTGGYAFILPADQRPFFRQMSVRSAGDRDTGVPEIEMQERHMFAGTRAADRRRRVQSDAAHLPHEKRRRRDGIADEQRGRAMVTNADKIRVGGSSDATLVAAFEAEIRRKISGETAVVLPASFRDMCDNLPASSRWSSRASMVVGLMRCHRGDMLPTAKTTYRSTLISSSCICAFLASSRAEPACTHSTCTPSSSPRSRSAAFRASMRCELSPLVGVASTVSVRRKSPALTRLVSTLL